VSLIGEGPIPLRLETGELAGHLLYDHIDPADALRHHVQLIHGLLLLLIELGDAGDLIYDLSALQSAHLNDAGDIALHHDVVALRGDPCFSQQLVQLPLGARFSIKIIRR
jgi:hypothetical protein